MKYIEQKIYLEKMPGLVRLIEYVGFLTDGARKVYRDDIFRYIGHKKVTIARLHYIYDIDNDEDRKLAIRLALKE